MKIVSVDMPQNLAEPLGLKPVKMASLGRVVMIAGANGSGKTRLLNALASAVQKKGSPGKVQAMLNFLRRQPPAAVRQQVRDLEEVMDAVRFDDEKTELLPKLIAFVPLGIELTDARRMAPTMISNAAGSIASILGFRGMENGALAYLQQIWSREFNATHQSSRLAPEVQVQAREALVSLQLLLRPVLGTELAADVDNNVTLFGKPIAEAGLSAGQRILLQLCVALHAQGTRLDDAILVLDEPERHLHPAAIVETLDRLSQLVPSGQIWVATHSLHLLAWVDPGAIWYMENGAVSYAGRAPEKVLGGLLGVGDHSRRLRNFLDLPAELARVDFAAQCLLPPTVSGATQDRQSKQIVSILEARETAGRPLRVLDVGAGRGRLLRALSQRLSDLSTRVDYFAVDAGTEHKQECLTALSEAYPGENRWFGSVQDARVTVDDGTVDVVVLCNVLHEVEPGDWLDLFQTLDTVLTAEGVLLLVEDQLIPVGEKAHPKGFLVLDTLAVKKLFSLEGTVEVIDHDGDGRLLAHVVPSGALGAVTRETRRAAITEVVIRSKLQIKELRRSGSTYKHGLQHAFWTQELANATLMLDELG